MEHTGNAEPFEEEEKDRRYGLCKNLRVALLIPILDSNIFRPVSLRWLRSSRKRLRMLLSLRRVRRRCSGRKVGYYAFKQYNHKRLKMWKSLRIKLLHSLQSTLFSLMLLQVWYKRPLLVLRCPSSLISKEFLPLLPQLLHGKRHAYPLAKQFTCFLDALGNSALFFVVNLPPCVLCEFLADCRLKIFGGVYEGEALVRLIVLFLCSFGSRRRGTRRW